MPLLEADKFLTELTKARDSGCSLRDQCAACAALTRCARPARAQLYERHKTEGTVWVTMKRSVSPTESCRALRSARRACESAAAGPRSELTRAVSVACRRVPQQTCGQGKRTQPRQRAAPRTAATTQTSAASCAPRTASASSAPRCAHLHRGGLRACARLRCSHCAFRADGTCFSPCRSSPPSSWRAFTPRTASSRRRARAAAAAARPPFATVPHSRLCTQAHMDALKQRQKEKAKPAGKDGKKHHHITAA